MTAQNRLHLPIYELEWIALRKGVTKFLATMKKFGMKSLEILSDNTVVVDSFSKNSPPISPTSEYYLYKIKNFLAKEAINYSVGFIPSANNKANKFSRDTQAFSRTSKNKIDQIVLPFEAPTYVRTTTVPNL
eukprot:GHVP01052527.1.p1 GENE.GHVP01052527.1~~GHVP01052527.1.p1  ORF type:complete len:132 (+),score=18.68 GHVP01052527.1:1441-1836(+)